MALLLQAAYCKGVSRTTAAAATTRQLQRCGHRQEDHGRSSPPCDVDDECHDPATCRRSFRLLNAACSVKCPRDFFAQILQEAPRADIDEPDENGWLPIHYAVHHAHADSQAYTQFVVESLLQVAPTAAAARGGRRGRGRLPLHMAVADTLLTWHKGGIKDLVGSYPSALRQVDPQTGLVPFLASATAATQSRLHLSTTYELLLAAPEMVHPCKWRKPPSTTTCTAKTVATTTTTATSATSPVAAIKQSSPAAVQYEPPERTAATAAAAVEKPSEPPRFGTASTTFFLL